MPDNIYALLVGIAKYNEKVTLDNGNVIFPQLNGCVNDVIKINSFLRQNHDEKKLFIKELHNDKATKENICENFINHLGLANEKDSVLFYFSGHGTQEHADECFKSETDRKLESLVCYYDAEQADRCFLADKELRYLIHLVAQKAPHVTVVIDSCHSADVTRNAQILKVIYNVPIEKKNKGTYTFPQRKWSDFIFHKEFSPEDVKAKGLQSLLPEGNHILFSASESNESAFELNGEGIFSKHFIDCLNSSHGIISNQGVFDRVSTYMKYAYVQKPRLYTPAHSATLRTTGFLNVAGSVGSGATVVFNDKRGWILNRGSISGLYNGMGPIDLVDGNNKSSLVKALIDKIEIDHAILTLPDDTDINCIFLADLDYLAKKVLKIFLSLDDSLPQDAAQLMDAISGIPPFEVEIISDESNADFTLQHLLGQYYLTRRDDKFRPVSSLVSYPNYAEIAGQLKHLSSWKFIRDLSKSDTANTSLTDYLQLEYSLGGEEYQKISADNGEAQLKIAQWKNPVEEPNTTLRFRLTNKSPGDLYVALFYLDINCSSSSFLLEPSPYHLGPGNSVELSSEGDSLLPVSFYPHALYFNYKEYCEWFKIIVSPNPFEAHPLKLEMLQEPPLPGEGTQMRTRGVVRGGIGTSKPLKEWLINTINIINVNPSYNKIDSKRLKDMLDDKVTAPFAEGQFFIPANADDNGSNPLVNHIQLLPGITIADGDSGKTDDSQRDALVNTANYQARKKRNNYCYEITRRHPEKIKIVLEGDSWFQHPFIYNLFDHLSKVYSINCVLTGGGTLANYFSAEKSRGDFFLDTLKTINPEFFLISGGGNDIFGPKFKDFLKEKPTKTTGSNGENKFLTESFIIQADMLMLVYKSVFILLKNEFPLMKTIIHGYDYPVHLDNTDKGWLSRCMNERGIGAADRRLVVSYMLDVFNEKLKQIADQFPGTVRYLDLRNTVIFKENGIDQWHDELHPNTDGFQLIGEKFIGLIETLKQS